MVHGASCALPRYPHLTLPAAVDWVRIALTAMDQQLHHLRHAYAELREQVNVVLQTGAGDTPRLHDLRAQALSLRGAAEQVCLMSFCHISPSQHFHQHRDVFPHSEYQTLLISVERMAAALDGRATDNQLRDIRRVYEELSERVRAVLEPAPADVPALRALRAQVLSFRGWAEQVCHIMCTETWLTYIFISTATLSPPPSIKHSSPVSRTWLPNLTAAQLRLPWRASSTTSAMPTPSSCSALTWLCGHKSVMRLASARFGDRPCH